MHPIKLLSLSLLLALTPVTWAQSGSDRPSMVVADVRVEPPNRQVRQLDIDSAFHSELLSAVRDTRRFRVLERNEANLDEIIDEQQLEASTYSNTSDARSGMIAAAGYVVVPYVSSFGLGANFTPLDAFPGMYDRRDFVRVEASVRVLNSETGELVFIADGAESYSRLVEAVQGRNGGPSRSIATTLIERLANELAAQIVNGVYPIMVADVSGGEVYLNRGGGGLSPGQRFDVFAQGRELIDPVTGESMGASVERRVGTIEVSRVEERFSTARIVEGEASAFTVGAIARPAD